MHFHTDQCHQEIPAKATMLYAIEIPSQGGDTLFANAYTAYETLPEDIKQRIAGRRAFNAYDQDTTLRSANYDNARASCWHPAVRTHPATGRKALYVNRLMTREIEGLPRGESDAILQRLFDHQEQPKLVYEHVWRPGDILMWDNRCTLHARSDFSLGERRLLRRVTILGETPVVAGSPRISSNSSTSLCRIPVIAILATTKGSARRTSRPAKSSGKLIRLGSPRGLDRCRVPGTMSVSAHSPKRAVSGRNRVSPMLPAGSRLAASIPWRADGQKPDSAKNVGSLLFERRNE